MSKKVYTIVYSAEKGQSLAQQFLASIRGFHDGHDLGKRLFIRDTKAQYRQSVLGLLWVLIMPIAQTLVWVFLSKGGVLNVDDTGVPYPLFVLTGIMLWRVFVEAVNAPLMMFNASKGMMSKINFPKEALLITAFYKVLFNLAVNLVVLLPLFIYYNLSFGWSMVVGLMALLPIILLGMTLGILITPFGALFNDVGRIVGTGLQLFFFLTPIIYPTPKEGFISLLTTYNPAAITILTARDLFFGQWSGLDLNYVLFIAAVLVILTLALVLYRISLPIIIERSGS